MDLCAGLAVRCAVSPTRRGADRVVLEIEVERVTCNSGRK